MPSDNVRITEVGPRDGLQNEAKLMPTAMKVGLIEALVDSGVEEIEITSFTRADWIPALADADEVARATTGLPATRYALVPNRRGLERAMATGVEGVTLVLSASESHNRANLNRSVGASIDDLLGSCAMAKAAGLRVRISLSVVFVCPFEGAVDPRRVSEIVSRFAAEGVERFGLCDTIGMANPRQVSGLCAALMANFPMMTFELHLHNTRGMGLANAYAGYLTGIRRFDSSIGGLGGCPFAPGASGNVATEDMAAMFAAMGAPSGLSADGLLTADRLVFDWLGRPLESAAFRTSLAATLADETEVMA